tara:strand:- start:5486 stop:6508 length:1023 start_codon:yes stop_codon:yes gene_type:complete
MSKLNLDIWGKRELITKGVDWFVNWADFPSISINNKSDLMIAHYLKKSSEEIFSYDVNYLVSKNKSWIDKFKMHNDSTFSEHGFVSITSYKNGFLSTWLDGRNTTSSKEQYGHASGPMSLRSAIINSEGEIIDESEIDNMVCDCCQTSLTVSDNIPIVVYRDRSKNEIRDISVSRFINSSWTNSYSLNDDNWKINGCPVNGPSIESKGKDVVVAWFSAADGNPQVSLKFSNNQGKSFGKKILINDLNNIPLGRVDLDFIDQKSVVVSWLSTNKGVGSINLRKINMNGNMGEIVSLSNVSSSRTTGFPQLERLKNDIFLSWTDETNGIKKIRTFKLPISSL